MEFLLLLEGAVLEEKMLLLFRLRRGFTILLPPHALFPFCRINEASSPIEFHFLFVINVKNRCFL